MTRLEHAGSLRRIMGQHSIAMNQDAFVAIKQFQHRLNRQGRVFSITRTMLYLVGFVEKISDEANTVASIKDVIERDKAWMHLISSAMAITPMQPSNRGQRPCHKATPEQRAYVVQQIIARLGISNPPKQLVDAYLDQGGMEPMIGSKPREFTNADQEALSGEVAARQALEESKAREKTQPEPLKTPLWSAPNDQP